MQLVLALWAFAAVAVPTCEAALSHRSALKALSSNVAGDAERTALRQSKETLSATVDAALRARSDVATFGPGNCMSAWRNEDGHCELETKCKDHDISKYALKFICIDAGGEKVRHVFAAGSFDPEEQFDTLIECKKCLAEKEETIQVIQPEKAAHSGKRKSEKLEKSEEEELGGAALKGLRNEVKELEAFMWNTSAALQELNAKVYNKSFKPPFGPPKNKKPCVDCDKVGEKAAAKALKAASSLVHHSTAHHQQVEEPRIEAEATRVEKEHRRYLAEEDGDDDESAATPKKASEAKSGKVDVVPSSLVSAFRTAEERGEEVPPSAVVPPRVAQVRKPKPLVVSLPKATDNDNDDESDEDEEEPSIPQSADEFERREEVSENKRPSISALQRREDDDDEPADEGDEDKLEEED